MRSVCTASVTYSGLDVLLLAILVILVWTPLVHPLQESVGKDGGSERVVTLRRYGTTYGGFYYPENLDYLSERSIVYCVGAGEDISHDLELGHQLGGDVYIFDPTPRAITHAEYIKALLDGREAQRPSPNFGGGDRDYLDKIVSTQMEAKRVHFYDYGLFTVLKTITTTMIITTQHLETAASLKVWSNSYRMRRLSRLALPSGTPKSKHISLTLEAE